MTKDLCPTTFAELPIGSRFVDLAWPDGWCTKTGDTTAIDGWCARGMELGFAPTDRVLAESSCFDLPL